MILKNLLNKIRKHLMEQLNTFLKKLKPQMEGFRMLLNNAVELVMCWLTLKNQSKSKKKGKQEKKNKIEPNMKLMLGYIQAELHFKSPFLIKPGPRYENTENQGHHFNPNKTIRSKLGEIKLFSKIIGVNILDVLIWKTIF